MDPDAQGNPVETQQDETPQAPTQTAPNPFEGVQQRINELTARFHDADRRAQANEERAQQALFLLAQQAQQKQNAEPELPELDPDQARAFQVYEQRMATRMAALEQQYRQQMANVEFSMVAQQSGDAPEVVQRANQLLQAWQQKGLNGWTVQDALIYARGEAAHKVAKQGAANNALNQFNAGAAPPVTHHAAPPNVAPRNDSVPADIDSWDIDKQLAFWEKRMGDKAF